MSDNKIISLDTLKYYNDKIIEHINGSIGADKQDRLVSGSNIKTINGNSLLGSGDITISGSGNLVQSDWNETDTTSSSYIANKPNIAYDDTEILRLKGREDGTKFLADDGTYKTLYTTTEIDNKIGDINTILESIING